MKIITCSSIADEIIAFSEKTPYPPQLARLPFIEVIWPWVGVARNRLLENRIFTFSCIDKQVISQLENILVQSWAELAAPSILLELGICKLRGKLEGCSSKARYHHFINCYFLDPVRLRSFFEEYAELGNRVSIILDLWVDRVFEFLERLTQDLPLLCDFFNGGNTLGKLMTIENLGDPHQGGKCVALLYFERGKKLLYKPKDLRIASRFNDFLDCLNLRGLTPQLKSYSILAKEGYGWEEYIENNACKDVADIPQYFMRFGMLICILYLLDGTDFHNENIIACGEFPIIIDAETLFHNEMGPLNIHMVFKTGMMPYVAFEENNEFESDTRVPGAPKWQRLGTDQIHLTYKRVRIKGSPHKVLYKNMKISSKNYVGEILQGFNKMYSFIMEHRTYLMRSGGPLDLMSELPVRIVIRMTKLYAKTKEWLTAPQFMLRPSQIDQALVPFSNRLEHEGKNLAPIIMEEKLALLRGDIPFFNAFPSKKHLYVRGLPILEEAFKVTSYERVYERIMQMNDADCFLQQGYIRDAFLRKKTVPAKKRG